MEFPNHKKFTQGSLVQLKHGNDFFYRIVHYSAEASRFFILNSVVHYSAEAPWFFFIVFSVGYLI